MWISGINNKFKIFFSKESQRLKTCAMEIFCSNYSFSVNKFQIHERLLMEQDVFRFQLKIPRSKHYCLHKSIGYKHLYLAQIMNCSAKTKASKYTCSTKVSCKTYNTGNNFWNLRVHYYIVFDFDFIWKDDFRVGVIDWIDCYSPSSTKKSWMEASTLCRHAGGTLPVIRSKDELEELISLKIRKWVTSNSIYISWPPNEFQGR